MKELKENMMSKLSVWKEWKNVLQKDLINMLIVWIKWKSMRWIAMR